LEDKIEGKVIYWRDAGRWYILLKAPAWVLEDISHEMHKDGDIMSYQGGVHLMGHGKENIKMVVGSFPKSNQEPETKHFEKSDNSIVQ